MSEDNKALARAIPEMLSEQDLSRLEDVCSPDLVDHDPTVGDVRGLDGMREVLSGYVNAFPDLRMTVEDQVAEGDKVFTRWIAEGTHQGELFGVAPSSNRITVHGMTIDRLEDGKIVESWDNWDALGLMQQIGAIPAEATA